MCQGSTLRQLQSKEENGMLAKKDDKEKEVACQELKEAIGAEKVRDDKK